MLRNYFITALRFFSKNGLFTAVNTLGLAVSISCAMLIYLYVINDLTYDEFHKDIDRLYVLGEGAETDNPGEPAYFQTVYPAFPLMLSEFPEIETGTRYFDWDAHILIAGDKRFMHQVHYVDSTFLQTLSFDLVEGDATTVLHKKGEVVISEEIALKMFDTTNVIGHVIEFENGKRYTVAGVLREVPENSTVRPQVLMSLQDKEDEDDFSNVANWYNTIAQVVIKLKPNTDVESLQKKFSSFVKKHYDAAAKERTLRLYPLADLRQSEADNEKYLYGLTSIGIFILLIAVINFTNLSIAGSLKRLRETGVRKLMGSTKRSIVLQFFLEACLLALLAAMLSVGLVQLILPWLNDVLGTRLELSTGHLSDAAWILCVITLFAGIVAGGYPGIYLSGYKISNAVKGIIPNYGGKAALRNALVVIQFIVSVILTISVIVTSRQIHFMKTADLKFNRENVLVVNMDAGFRDENAARSQLQGIVNAMRERADVISVSLSQNVPGRYWNNYNRFIGDNDESVSLRKAYVDEHYLDTYGIKILEGRNFSNVLSDSSNAIMLNKSAVKALGWKSATGKMLKENGSDGVVYTVVGVFDDFHYRSLEGSVEPLVHFYFNKTEHANLMSIRLVPNKASDVLTFVRSKWHSLDAWFGLDYFFVDEEFNKQYKAIERTLNLVSLFTGVAIVVCCAGVFALSAIAAQQRTKEIGIRKVLGASVMSIITLLSRDFIKLVIIAIVLAAPLAWYGMSHWLREFAYKTDLDWWIFAVASMVILLIALFTTGLQSIRAAMNNPVESLHND